MSKRRIPTLQPRVALLTRTLSTVRLSAPGVAERRRVYGSRRWRERVRPAKLLWDPLCQRCKFLGITERATDVDHWLTITQGGDPWDEDNLVSLCHSHHSEKTNCEKTGSPFPEIAPSTPRTVAR